MGLYLSCLSLLVSLDIELFTFEGGSQGHSEVVNFLLESIDPLIFVRLRISFYGSSLFLLLILSLAILPGRESSN